jgi:arylsulfatase A-like enzyme
VPFVAPKKYFDLYDINDFSVTETSDEYLKTIPKPAAASLRARKEQIDLDPALSVTIKHAYYATTSFMDAQIGRVLDKLKETGLDKNTIVVFTSDHGYHLGEHGHWQKQTLFQDATRVPLIFAGPGVKKTKKSVGAPVELVDIYPTLMDMVEMKTPSFVSGLSLTPFFDNPDSSIRSSAFTELQVDRGNIKAQGYGIQTTRYRLNQWEFNGRTEYELYDHKNDPEELKNLADLSSYNAIKDSLSIILNQRIVAAKIRPIGLGRQINNARPWNEPKRFFPKPK